MALKRTNVLFDNGLSALETYERIVSITIARSKKDNDASVSLNINFGLWTSKARSDAGNQAVEHLSIALRGDEAAKCITVNNDILATAYAAVKAHEPVRGEPDYRNASDV